MASLSLRAWVATIAAVSSPMIPCAWPAATDWREGVDVLVLDLLVDHGGEQAGGQPGVVGLLGDERGRGADGEVVELLGGGAVDEAGDGAGGDPHRRRRCPVPSAQRATARTILFRSTGSRLPSRLRTCMGEPVAVSDGSITTGSGCSLWLPTTPSPTICTGRTSSESATSRPPHCVYALSAGPGEPRTCVSGHLSGRHRVRWTPDVVAGLALTPKIWGQGRNYSRVTTGLSTLSDNLAPRHRHHHAR